MIALLEETATAVATVLVVFAQEMFAVSILSIDSVRNLTTHIITEATCSDNVLNNGETDTDCGGSNCSPCREGKTCNIESDCYGTCSIGVCGKLHRVGTH